MRARDACMMTTGMPSFVISEREGVGSEVISRNTGEARARTVFDM